MAGITGFGERPDSASTILIVDDSTLDKPHSRSISLTGIHWSGNHHKMVQGISLVTLVWIDGISTYPLDFRIYHKDSDGKTKNDHFQDMLRESAERGLNPDCVLFDSWYGSVDNLRLVEMEFSFGQRIFWI